MKHGHDWQFDQQMANGQDQDEEVELLWQMLRKMYLMQLKINFLHKISVTSDGRSIVNKIRLVNTSSYPSIMCNEAYLRHWCVPSAVQCCGHRADYYPITLLPWHLTPAHSFQDMWPGHRALVTAWQHCSPCVWATLCTIYTHALKRKTKSWAWVKNIFIYKRKYLNISIFKSWQLSYKM